MSSVREAVTEQEFEQLKEELFANANQQIAEFGNRLADYCWNLDKFANSQNWENQKNRLIVFGVPESIRVRSNAKNYFSIYAITSHDKHKLKCEVIFPKTAERQALISHHDTQGKLHISSINEVEGDFTPEDYDYLIKLINAARAQRVI